MAPRKQSGSKGSTQSAPAETPETAAANVAPADDQNPTPTRAEVPATDETPVENPDASAPEQTEQSEQTVECEICRDYWDSDGKRHRKGTHVSLPVGAVMDGLETGAIKRVKDDDA